MRSYQDLGNAVDDELHRAVQEARGGRSSGLAAVMRAHNQRLYRIARGILRDDAEAEDVVQDTFVKAFTELSGLRDQDNIGAWLAKIAANLALSRVRQKARRARALSSDIRLEDFRMADIFAETGAVHATPERQAAMAQVRKLLEREIDRLADGYREVFILRAVEQMSVAETAEVLGIRPETVKTRLHRAKGALRARLREHFEAVANAAFPFGGARCERTTAAVLARLNGLAAPPDSQSHH